LVGRSPKNADQDALVGTLVVSVLVEVELQVAQLQLALLQVALRGSVEERLDHDALLQDALV
jgi:hypothetical protein